MRLPKIAKQLTVAVVAWVAFSGAAAAPVGGAPAQISQPETRRDANHPNRFQAALRERLTTETIRARYGVKFSQDLGEVRRAVVHVHGFNSCPETAAYLIEPAQGLRLPVGAFAYPNDQSLAASALLLSAELKALSTRYPGLQIALVTHSMGGLVARSCIEDPQLDPGNVDQIIMVATPNHGSLLARYAVATDLWEHWLGRRKGWPWTRTRDAIVDGLGEAAIDLTPGSEFLVTLNNRPRNPRVAYTLLLGSGGTVTAAEVAWARDRACRTLNGIRARRTAACVNDYLSELDEIVAGRGDGVVALKRARLAGVDDTVVLPFGHLEIVCAASDRAPASEAVLAVRKIICDRLAAGSHQVAISRLQPASEVALVASSSTPARLAPP